MTLFWLFFLIIPHRIAPDIFPTPKQKTPMLGKSKECLFIFFIFSQTIVRGVIIPLSK